jgi:hypothetical protein
MSYPSRGMRIQTVVYLLRLRNSAIDRVRLEPKNRKPKEI